MPCTPTTGARSLSRRDERHGDSLTAVKSRSPRVGVLSIHHVRPVRSESGECHVHEPPDDPVAWVEHHLGDLLTAPVVRSDIRGGQTAADEALSRVNLTGYAERRNTVLPLADRGATGLSPYVRHGFLQLPDLWQVAGPDKDVQAFRNELLWQEYARHLYARLGTETRNSLRFAVHGHEAGEAHPWRTDALCVSFSYEELTTRGWLTNQTRMWLASHWTVRSGHAWQSGEDWFFRNLLDGSRAANRVGWQWTVGALTGKPYAFRRWQVMDRAPQLCAQCTLADACPIEAEPVVDQPTPLPVVDPRMRRESRTSTEESTQSTEPPAMVWLTAESLGDRDPALRAHPDLPVVFVFDLPLLKRLRLSSQRLVFLAESLADLALRREVWIGVGDPVEVLGDRALAATAAPVPGWPKRAQRLNVVARYRWPWLVEPHDGPVTSFTAWRKYARR